MAKVSLWEFIKLYGKARLHVDLFARFPLVTKAEVRQYRRLTWHFWKLLFLIALSQQVCFHWISRWPQRLFVFLLLVGGVVFLLDGILLWNVYQEKFKTTERPDRRC